MLGGEGIFVSNWAFLCRTMHFAVEPGFFVSNEYYNTVMSTENIFKFHWSLFLRLQWVIRQDWFMWWLGPEQVPIHYPNQWWPGILAGTHIWPGLNFSPLSWLSWTNAEQEIVMPADTRPSSDAMPSSAIVPSSLSDTLCFINHHVSCKTVHFDTRRDN